MHSRERSRGCPGISSIIPNTPEYERYCGDVGAGSAPGLAAPLLAKPRLARRRLELHQFAQQLNGSQEVRIRPRPELKPGTRRVREWQGRTYDVLVLDDGFSWQGTSYRSLSASSWRQDASGGSGYVLVNEQDRQPGPWPFLTTLGDRDQAPREAQCGFGEQQARARCRWCSSRDHDQRLVRCSG
jgi:hypothetical protein